MKRDARIGLAVVLVLGLAVTLLIGRAISKRAEVANGGKDAALAQAGAAQYSTDVARVDGVDAAQVSAAAAAAPNAPAQPITPTETAARAPEPLSPALDKFVQDQTRRMPTANTNALLPGEKADTGAPGAGAAPARGPARDGTGAVGGHNSKPAAGSGTPPSGQPPHLDPAAWRDDNDPSAVPPAAEPQAPADGFGYIVAAGDNIWKISTKVYGDGKYTQKIMDANPGLDTRRLKPGAVIRIPVITHKTILMKLPSFADAKKGVTTGTAEIADKAKPHGADGGPVAANKAVHAPEKAAGDGLEATTHKVEAGETLSSIAKKYFGANGPKTIAMFTAANKGLDPAKLKVGQEIVIPAKK